MTMEVPMKPIVMPAGEFKAKCLSVMDQVRDRRTPVTITKNGKPVVRMVPIEEEADPIFGFLRDKIKIVGDVTAPIYTQAEYEQFFEAEAAKYDSLETVATK
jgi:prevent-host-death family protein